MKTTIMTMNKNCDDGGNVHQFELQMIFTMTMTKK